MFNGTAYLERAAPRFATAKFLVLAFLPGLFIELAPGSNCPGRIFWPGRSAVASRFLVFCAAFAFARRRALALVMSSSPFQVAWWNFDHPLGQKIKPFCECSSGQPPEGAVRSSVPCRQSDNALGLQQGIMNSAANLRSPSSWLFWFAPAKLRKPANVRLRSCCGGYGIYGADRDDCCPSRTSGHSNDPENCVL